MAQNVIDVDCIKVPAVVHLGDDNDNSNNVKVITCSTLFFFGCCRMLYT